MKLIFKNKNDLLCKILSNGFALLFVLLSGVCGFIIPLRIFLLIGVSPFPLLYKGGVETLRIPE